MREFYMKHTKNFIGEELINPNREWFKINHNKTKFNWNNNKICVINVKSQRS